MQPPDDLPERPTIQGLGRDFAAWTDALAAWSEDPRVKAWHETLRAEEERRVLALKPALDCPLCEAHRIDNAQDPWVVVECGPHRVATLMAQAAGFPAAYRPVPARYATADPAHLIPALRSWDGTRGLYLAGPVGTGKTYQAAALVRMRFRMFDPADLSPHGGAGYGPWGSRRRPVEWRNVPKLLEDVRRSFDSPESAPQGLEHVPLLVLDDIGAEKPSEWVEERLYCIVNERYENDRPLIVTSNLTPNQLGGQVGARLASRLREMCEVHGLGGRDRRLKAAS